MNKDAQNEVINKKEGIYESLMTGTPIFSTKDQFT